MSHKVPGDDGGRWWSHEELSLLATPSYFDACFLDLDRVNSIYANRTRDLLSLSLSLGRRCSPAGSRCSHGLFVRTKTFEKNHPSVVKEIEAIRCFPFPWKKYRKKKKLIWAKETWEWEEKRKKKREERKDTCLCVARGDRFFRRGRHRSFDEAEGDEG